MLSCIISHPNAEKKHLPVSEKSHTLITPATVLLFIRESALFESEYLIIAEKHDGDDQLKTLLK